MMKSSSCPLTGNVDMPDVDPSRASPELARVREAVFDPSCYVACVSGGMALGLLDAWTSHAMGYTVLFRGQDAYYHQLAFHMLIFGIIGFFIGRAWDRRRQLAHALNVIQRQYEDLKANQQQLIQSEKLAVIGSLSASIAHEIRNPLGIMRSSAQLVGEDLPPDHPNQKPLEFIRDEIDRLSGLIEGLLVFAKPKQPTLAPSDVNRLVERASSFVGAELRKRNIELVRTLAPALPAAHVDGDQLHQVFLGLLLNAMQSVREQGRISVDTELVNEGPAPTIRIQVTDSGKGIPEENLEKIFEPFFTTKPEGTGLGLAVARQIINGHGGSIRAGNAAGAGAVFSIELPLAPMPA